MGGVFAIMLESLGSVGEGLDRHRALPRDVSKKEQFEVGRE